jgi:hypothetical protein
MKWQNYIGKNPFPLWNLIIIVQDFQMSVNLKFFSVGLLLKR